MPRVIEVNGCHDCPYYRTSEWKKGTGCSQPDIVHHNGGFPRNTELMPEDTPDFCPLYFKSDYSNFRR